MEKLMYRLSQYFLTLLIFISFVNADAQLDSLRQVLSSNIHDSVKLKTLTAISEECSEDSIQFYTQPGLKLCDELLEKYPDRARYLSLLKS